MFRAGFEPSRCSSGRFARIAEAVVVAIFALAIGLVVSLDAEAACEAGSTTPSVSIGYSGPDANGLGTVSISYNFPNTSSGSQRRLWFQVNGVNKKTLFYPSQPQGVWTFSYDTTCWLPGTYRFTAWAEACGRWEDGFIASADHDVVVQSSKPSVSLSYTDSAPDQLGKIAVRIDYNFPRTASSTQRRIWFQVDTVNKLTNFYPAQQQGTWSFDYDLSCLTPGSHLLTAWVEACGKWETDFIEKSEQSVEVTQPSVTLLSTDPDPLGKIDVSIAYDFPNTSSHMQRRIWFQVDQVNKLTNFYPTTPAGTWNFQYDLSCLPPGPHELTAWVESCGKWETGYIDSAEQNVQIGAPEANVNLSQATDGSWDAIVNYDFPQTSSFSQRYLRLEWLPAGTLIAELRPTDVSGQWVVDLPGCVVGSQEAVRITATSCSSASDVDEAPAFLPDCEVACSVECPDCVGQPVRITSGNMRLSDAEPLPAGDLGALSRTYDSKGTAGVFGKGWMSLFDARATIRGGIDGRETVFIVTESGDRYFFVRTGSIYRQKYPAGERRPTILTYDATRNAFVHRGGSSSLVRVFRGSDGRLSAMRRVSNPDETTITYDANGRPTGIQDGQGGWAWSITTNTAGRIETVAVASLPQLVWTYSYDGDGKMQSVSNANGLWRTYTYGPSGIEEARDGAGRLLEGHQYDGTGKATTSTGASDDITEIAYDLPGRITGEKLTRVTASSGRITNYYSRYIAGKMRTVEVDGTCDCGAEDVVFGYDDEGRIVREQNARGFITTRIFDEGRVIEEITSLRPTACVPETDPDHCRLSPDDLKTVWLTSTGATTSTSFAYGDSNWADRATAISTSSVRNPAEQRRQEYVYDAATGEVVVDRLIGWTGEPSVQQIRTTTTTLYDGAEAAAFDPGGAFSAWALLPQPRGTRKSVNGSRTDVTDISTFVHYPHDSAVPALLRGKLAASRDPLGHITRYESYDVFGAPTRIVDANGVATEMTYDALGRPLTTTVRGVPGCDTVADPLCTQDITTSRAYEAGNGPLSLEERPGGGITLYAYDNRGRILTITRGPAVTDLRERMEYQYDPITGQKTLERILGHEGGAWVETRRESSEYDGSGRLIRSVNADGTSTGFSYQAGGLLASIRDENHSSPNNFQEYDAAGRLSRVRQMLGSGEVVTAYAYDSLGNLVSVTDPNSNVTLYLYDDFGQMLRQTSPVTGVTNYQYDAAGNLVAVTDANEATTARSYDASNRLIAAVSSRPGTATETVTWTYGDVAAGPFAKNRMTSMTDPTGSTSYTYDRRGLLAREAKTIGQATYTTSFTHEASGNRATITYPSGRLTTYTHDHAGRPVSLTSAGATIISSASYLPFGPATRLVLGNGTTQTFTRDTRYLPLRNTLSGTATLADYDYGRDAIGNVTRIDDLLDPGYDRTFAYDGLNRLVSANGGASLWGAGSYSYDGMGNQLSLTLGTTRAATFTMVGTTPKIAAATENGTERLVGYDAAGNETTVGATTYAHSARNQLLADGTRTYAYDGRGIRTITSTPSQHRYSLYTPELNLLAETETTGSATPSVIWEYLWFAGQPAAQIDNTTGAIAWYFVDHLGTPILQTNGAGQITWRVEYEPYGSIFAYRAGNGAHQPLRFPGQEQEGVDDSYNIFRWYRSGWGRYTQADPIGITGIGSSATNPYVYVSGQPTRLFDSLGLFEMHDSCDSCITRSSAGPSGPHSPGRSPSANQYSYIYSRVQNACQTVVPRITNVSLRRCLERQCRDGIIECRDSCPRRQVGGTVDTVAARIFRQRGAPICINNWRDLRYHDPGRVAIHEWAHGCGWLHGQPGGVPGRSGDFQDEDGVPPRR